MVKLMPVGTDGGLNPDRPPPLCEHSQRGNSILTATRAELAPLLRVDADE
jgi:hypothetical protein